MLQLFSSVFPSKEVYQQRGHRTAPTLVPERRLPTENSLDLIGIPLIDPKSVSRCHGHPELLLHLRVEY